ncbi:MAG: FtsX-like permease family protein [Gemmatimonadetes bacterium]|nr:FtsX-like permease family protein [Gemmatimonadota bacterium]MYD26667.1 FtsX-like permease family protein [Gemmatimonadota bacterium]
MIRNYITTAVRNILKYKGYSVINVIGLAIGLAGCVLMLLYVQYEFSYDGYHEKKDRIYRLENHSEMSGIARKVAISPAPWGPALLNDYPGIEAMARVKLAMGRHTIQHGDKAFYGEAVVYADSTLFEIFTFPLVRGNPRTALAAPFTAVVSESFAKEHFGGTDPIGLSMNIPGFYSVTVTGVMSDVPLNSHVRFDYLTSYATWTSLGWGGPETFQRKGLNSEVRTFLLLREGYPVRDLEAQLPLFIEKYLGDRLRSSGIRVNPVLRPIEDIHLYCRDVQWSSGLVNSEGGDIRFIYIAVSVAAFILVIACINFINLTTARAARRAREVSMRKILGSRRIHVVFQFIGETVLLSLFALALAVALLHVLVPTFNELFGTGITMVLSLELALMLTGMVLLTGMLAGIYPAFVLSSFRPTDLLRGPMKTGTARLISRRVLVVFQFSIAIIMISGIGVISDQIVFMQNKDPGFDAEGVVVVALPRGEDAMQKYDVFKANALSYPDVLAVSQFAHLPESLPTGGVRPPDVPEDQLTHFQMIHGGYDLHKAMGFEVVQGRYFSRDRSTDANACVINETAVRALGWNDSVGKSLISPYSQELTVIGVIRDFHTRSFHHATEPIWIGPPDQRGQAAHIVIKLRAQNVAGALGILKDQWREIYPDQPEMEHLFLSNLMEDQYRGDRLLGTIFTAGTLVSILIACLGLLGLSAFMVQSRIKEVGVRKVLGASVGQVVILLYREFTLYVLIAWVVGVPLIYYMADVWLRDFAYRVEPNPWTFVLTGVVVMLITWFTVGFQTVKAAETNPVEVLRG